MVYLPYFFGTFFFGISSESEVLAPKLGQTDDTQRNKEKMIPMRGLKNLRNLPLLLTDVPRIIEAKKRTKKKK